MIPSFYLFADLAQGTIKVLTQIMGLGVATIGPIVFVYITIKASEGILGKIGGFINNPNRGPIDKLRKGAQAIRDQSKVNRGLRAMDPNKQSMPGRRAFRSWRNNRNAINKGRAEQLEELQKEQIAQKSVSSDGFAKKVAGDKSAVYQARQQSYLASINPEKLELDADKAMMEAKISEITLSVKDPANKIGEVQKKLADAVTGGDAVTARAAQDILMNSGNKGKNALRQSLMSVDRNSEVGVQMRKDLAASNMKGSAADVYQWSIDGQNRSLADISSDSATWSGLSDAQAMGQVAGAMQAAVDSNGFTAERADEILHARGAENIGTAEKTILEKKAGITSAQGTQPTAVQAPPPNQGQNPTQLNIPHGTQQVPVAASPQVAFNPTTQLNPNRAVAQAGPLTQTSSGLLVPNGRPQAPPQPPPAPTQATYTTAPVAPAGRRDATIAPPTSWEPANTPPPQPPRNNDWREGRSTDEINDINDRLGR